MSLVNLLKFNVSVLTCLVTDKKVESALSQPGPVIIINSLETWIKQIVKNDKYSGKVNLSVM